MHKLILKEKEYSVMGKEEQKFSKKKTKSLDHNGSYPQFDDEVPNLTQDIGSLKLTKKEKDISIKIIVLKEKIKNLSGIRYLMIGELNISLVKVQNMKQY